MKNTSGAPCGQMRPLFEHFVQAQEQSEVSEVCAYATEVWGCRKVGKEDQRTQKRKRDADEASPYIADDGKKFQQVMTPSGPTRNVLVQ